MQRRRSPENASLRSDGIQPHSYCLTECLLALPCDKSCPGTVVTTALGLEQLELAKGVPVILAVTSPFQAAVCLGFFSGTNISSNCFQLMWLLRAALRKLGARLRVRYSRQVTAEGLLGLQFPSAHLRQEHQIKWSWWLLFQNKPLVCSTLTRIKLVFSQNSGRPEMLA